MHNWDLEEQLEKLLPSKGSLSTAFNTKLGKRLSKNEITDELLEECYVYMAHVVEKYGRKSLPIFQRLHQEIDDRKTEKQLINLALSVTQKHPKH